MTQHKPGKFVWFELLSTDSERANSFYSEVIGWTIEGVDMGGFTYPMIKSNGAAIGGIKPTQGNARSHWISYLSVEDVDAALARLVEAGGRAQGEAIDAPGVGRFVRASDPQGAELFLFKSIEGDPQDDPAPVGGWHWNELWARDGAAAQDFYCRTFSYTSERMNMPNGDYYVLKSGETSRAGVMTMPHEIPAAMWLPYIRVDNLADRLGRATELGAKVLDGPNAFPNIGTIAIVQDPTGGVIGLITPAN